MTKPALRFRAATGEDLPALVAMLADDPLGQAREAPGEPLADDYRRAFASIHADPGNLLLVACEDGEVQGFLQLTFITCLSYRGGTRAQIESVRERRSAGIGRALIVEALTRARERGCHLVQLTTDKTRPEALRFYERLGFRASHEGLKLHLDGGAAR